MPKSKASRASPAPGRSTRKPSRAATYIPWSTPGACGGPVRVSPPARIPSPTRGNAARARRAPRRPEPAEGLMGPEDCRGTPMPAAGGSAGAPLCPSRCVCALACLSGAHARFSAWPRPGPGARAPTGCVPGARRPGRSACLSGASGTSRRGAPGASHSKEEAAVLSRCNKRCSYAVSSSPGGFSRTISHLGESHFPRLPNVVCCCGARAGPGAG